MTDALTTGLAFVSNLGLPQVLLWVLTFAVMFELLTKLKVLSKVPAAITSVILGLFVLMAAPGAVIASIATMSTGLLIVAIGFVVVLSIFEVGGISYMEKVKKGDKDGNWAEDIKHVKPFQKHGKAMTILGVIIASLIFVAAGGPALIGITALPTIGMGTWALVIVGGAVLWMVYSK